MPHKEENGLQDNEGGQELLSQERERRPSLRRVLLGLVWFGLEDHTFDLGVLLLSITSPCVNLYKKVAENQ